MITQYKFAQPFPGILYFLSFNFVGAIFFPFVFRFLTYIITINNDIIITINNDKCVLILRNVLKDVGYLTACNFRLLKRQDKTIFLFGVLYQLVYINRFPPKKSKLQYTLVINYSIHKKL